MTQVKTSTPSVSITNSTGTKEMTKKGTKKNNPSKNKKKDKELTKTNLAKAEKEVATTTQEREVKYAYPADCKTAAKKKVFRRNARAAMSKFNKALEALKGSHKPEDISKRKELDKERADFMKETYTGKS